MSQNYKYLDYEGLKAYDKKLRSGVLTFRDTENRSATYKPGDSLDLSSGVYYATTSKTATRVSNPLTIKTLDGDIEWNGSQKETIDLSTNWVIVKGDGENSAVLKGLGATASAKGAISLGYNTQANKAYSFAEGHTCISDGAGSHAEGYKTKVSGQRAHAEGSETEAQKLASHAEGGLTKASGNYSHAEGLTTNAGGIASHAEGGLTNASGDYSHTEGYNTTAVDDYSHAEGYYTEAKGLASHTEGGHTKAETKYTHAEGEKSVSSLKGYYYTEVSLDTKQIRLSNLSNRSVRIIPTITITSGELTPGDIFPISWEVGDEVSIINDEKYDRCAKITDINGDIITLDKLPFDENTVITTPVTWGEYNYKYEFSISTIKINDDDIDDTKWRKVSLYNNGEIDLGEAAHAEGVSTWALARGAHAEGIQTVAYGQYSHAEGRLTQTAYCAHAEGHSTQALEDCAHAEGYKTIASGKQAHAEGYNSVASGELSHAEGAHSKAQGKFSHAEGYTTDASGNVAHAEGANTIASGRWSHTEGHSTEATNDCAHAEGHKSKATGLQSHAEGKETVASGNFSHAEGKYSIADGESCHVEGINCKTDNKFSNPIGAHAEGYGTITCSYGSHAEGFETIAGGSNTDGDPGAHAEGIRTIANRGGSHAEGGYAFGDGTYMQYAHGGYAYAGGSHAEGISTIANGQGSHAEGGYVHVIPGDPTTLEGTVFDIYPGGTANGQGSHAEGVGTITQNIAEHASGRYNISTENETLFSVGNGTSDSDRKNAFEIKNNNTAYINGEKILTEQYKYEDKVVKISYKELYNLKENANLTSGIFYRITDYECITTQTNTQNANHPFDIIVQALDEKTLSENASAIQREGDEYFANSNLNTWKLKYNIDNDTSRFAWAKKEIKEQPAKWYCEWGVLEERYDNDNGASTNYELRTIDGINWYLYRPEQPTNHLEGKMFYRYEGRQFVNIDNGETELYFVTESNPFTESATDIRVIHKETGMEVDSWPLEWDGGVDPEGDDNYYYADFYAEDYGTSMYMKCSGESIQINGKTYYKWVPYDDDYTQIEDYVSYMNPFITEGGEKIYYDGSIDNLYYAFLSILPNNYTTVYYITDGNHIYEYEDADGFEEGEIDIIRYSAYVTPIEGGKGVIYEMIDEYNNRCPYDFKNIQFKHTDGHWYYTFNYFDTDMSKNYVTNNKTLYCSNNIIKNEFSEKLLPCIIIKCKSESTTANCYRNQIIGYTNSYLEGTNISENIINSTTNDSVATINIIATKGSINKNIFNGIGKINITNPNSNIGQNTFELPFSPFNITLNPTGAFIRNTFYLKCSWGGFTFNNGSLKDCYIEDFDPGGYTTINPTLELSSNCVMSFCKIKLSSKLKIEYNNTTSSALSLTNLNINAARWGDETIIIPSTFPTNSSYELKVAKNSNGEIKMWCDADLIN